ncbi:MAG: hypothetical protein LKM30_02560 [Bacilli bacterium]|jgi:hypothetical protein|nr:hypothetical protein [Bacilli bacterium]
MTSDSKKVLILFEGSTDKKQFSYLARTFSDLLKNGGYQPVVFGTSIYELYKPLIQEQSFDCLASYLAYKHLFDFPKEARPQDYFSLIYLIFDFDPCYHLFDARKIEALQSYFNDETRNGLLYINFPMVEALFDFSKVQGKYQIRSEYPLATCSSDSYKRHIRLHSAFVSPKDHHLYRFLPESEAKTAALLSLGRYRELLSLSAAVPWTLTDIPALLKKEEAGVDIGVVYPLSCFPFMALDYNAAAALEEWKK